MTAIAHRRPGPWTGPSFEEDLGWGSLEEALAHETDLAEIGSEYAAGVAQLVDAARAPDATAAQLGALARRRKAGLLRATEESRHRMVLQDRRVWVQPLEDGMAQLTAVLDAAVATAIADRLENLAARTGPTDLGGAPRRAGGPAPFGEAGGADDAAEETGSVVAGGRRTLAQRRADALADLLLDGEPADWPGHLRGVRGRVTVTVPALALAERSGMSIADLCAGWLQESRCADLAGYGPVPAGMIERIAAAASSWARILTDPITGVVLDHDRTTYAVPAALKRLLRARDGGCRFPGCRRPTQQCELDHTVAWEHGGTTAADNLAHLCRPHHRLKHRAGPLGPWQVRQVEPPGTFQDAHAPRDPGRGPRAGGVLEWISPAGQVHRTYPQDFHGPEPAGGPPGQRLPAPLDDPPPF